MNDEHIRSVTPEVRRNDGEPAALMEHWERQG
jgi:hypothetical protein